MATRYKMSPTLKPNRYYRKFLNPWYPVVFYDNPAVLEVQPSERLRAFTLLRHRKQHDLLLTTSHQLQRGLDIHPYVHNLLERVPNAMDMLEAPIQTKTGDGEELVGPTVINHIVRHLKPDMFDEIMGYLGIDMPQQESLLGEYTRLNKYGEFKDASFDMYKHFDRSNTPSFLGGGGAAGGGGGGI